MLSCCPETVCDEEESAACGGSEERRCPLERRVACRSGSKTQLLVIPAETISGRPMTALEAHDRLEFDGRPELGGGGMAEVLTSLVTGKGSEPTARAEPIERLWATGKSETASTELCKGKKRHQRPDSLRFGGQSFRASQVMVIIIIVFLPTEPAYVCLTHVVVPRTKVSHVGVSLFLMIKAKRVTHRGQRKIVDDITANKHPVSSIYLSVAFAAPMIAEPMESGSHL